MPHRCILYDILPSPPCRAVKVLAKALNVELDLKTVDLINRAQYSEEFLKNIIEKSIYTELKMSKKPILYEILPSPPTRAVKVLAEALNLELELKTVDLINRAQYSEDFLKINPAHTVPALDDDGVILWDSHAILIYLADKYAKDDTLYPKDTVKRAMVNQVLFLDTSIFAKFIGIMRPIMYGETKGITKSQIANVEDSYDTIEKVLEGKRYVTGNNVTLADISLVASLTSFDLAVPISSDSYPNIKAWIKRMEELPYYEPNAVGLEAHAPIIKRFVS